MSGIPRAFNGKPLKWAWAYPAADGSTIGIVARYQDDSGKEVIPFFRATDTGRWAAGAPAEPRPLFGLDRLTAAGRRTAFVVEGERCAAALQGLGLTATTSLGGCKAASKSDWAPLSGIEMAYVLPDRDGPGESYARDVCRILAELPKPPTVRVVRLPELPPGGDIVDWLMERLPSWDGFKPVPEDDRERLLAELRAAVKAHAELPPPEWTSQSAADEWEPPVPLDDGDELPPWPDDVFPARLGEFVSGVAAATETPVELSGMLTLACLAASAQGRFELQVEPGYREPLALWTATALPPGNRKSAVFEAITQPLMAWEARQREAIEPEIVRVSSERATLQQRIDNLRRAAAKKSGPELADAAAEIAALEAELPEVPHTPQVWADDVTVEKLGALMSENDGKMAILSDEGGLFETVAGRYSGGTPNLDLLLKGHAGGSVRVDRGSRPPVYLRKALLSLGLAVQPDVLAGLADKPGFRGRGLVARFLFALPRSNLGHRTGETVPLPGDLRLAWHGCIEAILNAPPGEDEDGRPAAHVLRLSPEARATWKDFWHRTERGMGPGGRFEHMTDWAGKLPGAVARIAGLLHVARHATTGPEKREVSDVDMQSAVRIAGFLEAHALATFVRMGADPEIDGANHVLAWLRRTEPGRFTLRECHRGLQSRFKRAAELEPCLEVLAERGYLKLEPAPPGPRGGRPSRVFVVNPNLH